MITSSFNFLAPCFWGFCWTEQRAGNVFYKPEISICGHENGYAPIWDMSHHRVISLGILPKACLLFRAAVNGVARILSPLPPYPAIQIFFCRGCVNTNSTHATSAPVFLTGEWILEALCYMGRECLFMSPPPSSFLAPVTIPVPRALNHLRNGGRDAVTFLHSVTQFEMTTEMTYILWSLFRPVSELILKSYTCVIPNFADPSVIL